MYIPFVDVFTDVDKRLKALTQTVRIPSEYKLNMTASKILMKERSVSHSRVCHSSVTDEYEDLKYTDETELLNHLTKVTTSQANISVKSHAYSYFFFFVNNRFTLTD